MALLGAGALAALLVVRFVVLPRPAYSDTRGADIVRYRLDSKLLGRGISEVAVVPAGNGARPLLVFLHGRHDSRPWNWLVPTLSGSESELTNAFFAALARLGRRAPVVVFLNGGGHTYYHDRRGGPFGSQILREAIPDALRRFRTVRGRIAIGGISMGGYGALHLAALEPRRWCAVGGHSAALWERSADTPSGAFDDAEDFRRNDVFRPASRERLARSAVWLDVGSKDPFREADTALAGALRRSGAKVTFHVWPGTHARSYWDAHMVGYLRFYAGALATCGA